MSLYLCEECAHEFENSAGANVTCDWCGRKERLKVLADQTEVEQLLGTIFNPMFSRANEKVMTENTAIDDTIFAASNFECEVEFFKCSDHESVGLTITDHGTGRVLDIIISRAALLAVLSSSTTPDEPCCCGKMECKENHQL